MYNLLCGGSDELAHAAARAIQNIISHCGPSDLAELDGKVRGLSEWLHVSIQVIDVVHRSFGHVGALGVMSFDRSGFVRETAVRRLAEAHDGQELSFLLIRLNDWVSEVRDAARRAVLQRMRAEYAPHWVRCLPLVYRLQQQSREDHQQVVESVTLFLRAADCRSSLRCGMLAADRSTRRLAFGLLTDAPAEDLLSVLADAIQSKDSVIRLWAARLLRQKLDGFQLRELLDRLGNGRFMPVRREALYGIIEKFPELVESRLRAAILDPHASMREVARFFLRQRGEADFKVTYGAQLDEAQGDQLAAAITGIGETGTAEDAGRLIRFLHHPNPNPVRLTPCLT